jgi:nitrite reductase/ring-hydroxylating ferredoxin subunit
MSRYNSPGTVVSQHPVSVRVAGRDILLVRTQDGLFALEDLCPHAQQELSTGSVQGNLLTCKHHGVQIDIKTGQVVESMGFLGLQPVEVFEVTETAGSIWIELPDD